LIGPRKNRYTKDGRVRAIPASNIPLVVLGAMLLWIGWFGFNGGSVLDFSSKESVNLFAKVIVNTNSAGLTGAMIASIIVYWQYKKFDITMTLNGALGGLVAITAGADVVEIGSSLLIGGIGGALVVLFVPLFDKFRIDDPVGALSVHLVNGIWGTIAVGIFANFSLITQLKTIAIVGVFSFGLSFVIFFLISKIIPLRADQESEYTGLDIDECGIESYPEFVKNI
jgi:Amt family ammonium transporter